MLSAVLTAIVRKCAIHTSFVAHPSEDRYHRSIIPLGGGIAIFATLVVFLLSATVAIKILPTRLAPLAQTANINLSDFSAKINQLAIMLLCIFILFVLG